MFTSTKDGEEKPEAKVMLIGERQATCPGRCGRSRGCPPLSPWFCQLWPEQPDRRKNKGVHSGEEEVTGLLADDMSVESVLSFDTPLCIFIENRDNLNCAYKRQW